MDARREQLAGGQGPAARAGAEAPPEGRVLVQGRPGRPGEVQAELHPEVLGRDRGQRGQVRPRRRRPAACKDKATGKIPEFFFGSRSRRSTRTTRRPAARSPGTSPPPARMGGGGGATFTLNGVDTSGEFRRIKAFLHAQGFQGRHGGPHQGQPREPRRPGLAGALEPHDVEGVSTLTKRYWDWDSQDAHLGLRAVHPPRPPRERRLALRSRRRPRHLRRRPQLLRRQGRVLQVEAGRRGQRSSRPVLQPVPVPA